MHLDAEAVLWQKNDSVAGSDSTESDSAAGNGDVTVPLFQCPELVALPSQQGSVFATPKAHLRIGTWVAQRHQAMSPLVQTGLHNSPFLFLSKPGMLRHLGESLFKTAKANTYYNSNSK